MFVKGDDDVDFAYIAEVIDIGTAANVDHIGSDDAQDSGRTISFRFGDGLPQFGSR